MKNYSAREKLQNSVRESDFLYVKKLKKRPKIRFTHTFDFHVEKKNTGKRGGSIQGSGQQEKNLWEGQNLSSEFFLFILAADGDMKILRKKITKFTRKIYSL